jgi:hypothetical protein
MMIVFERLKLMIFEKQGALHAMMDFLASVVCQEPTDSACKPSMDLLLQQFGLRLVQTLFLGLSGAMSRLNANSIADVLQALSVRCPRELREWAREAVASFSPVSIPGRKGGDLVMFANATAAEKEQFISSLLKYASFMITG